MKPANVAAWSGDAAAAAAAEAGKASVASWVAWSANSDSSSDSSSVGALSDDDMAASAASTAADTGVAEADRAAGEAAGGAARATWGSSKRLSHRARTHLRQARNAGKDAAGAAWRRPNRKAKRRVARLVKTGAIPPTKYDYLWMWELDSYCCCWIPNCPNRFNYRRTDPSCSIPIQCICPLCRDEGERRHQRYLSR